MWGFKHRRTAEAAAALTRQMPPDAYAVPATSNVIRSWIVEAPAGGIPGKTDDTPGKVKCKVLFIDTTGKLQYQTKDSDGEQLEIEVYNISGEVFSEGDLAMCWQVGGVPTIGTGVPTTELSVLTSLTVEDDGKICFETATIQVMSSEPTGIPTCLDLCEAIKCCETLIAVPEECEFIPGPVCQHCEFADDPISGLTITDDSTGETYTQNGVTFRIDECTWNVPMADSLGTPVVDALVSFIQQPGDTGIWDVSHILATLQSSVLDPGCSGSVALTGLGDPNDSGSMTVSGRLATAAMDAQAFLRRISTCRTQDVEAMIARWGESKSREKIEELANMIESSNENRAAIIRAIEALL